MTEASRSLVQRYLALGPHAAAVFSWPALAGWRDFFTWETRLIDGNLCVFARNETGVFLYWPPLGTTVSRRAVREAFAYMDQVNQGSGVTRMDNVEHGLKASLTAEGYTAVRSAMEYVYARCDVAELRGRRYKAKRSSYNLFVRRYRSVWRPYEEGMAEECLALYDRWASRRSLTEENDLYRVLLEDGRCFHRFLLRGSGALGLLGRVVVIDGRIRAYTLGYPLDATTFCVALEIGDLDFPGIAVFVFRRFCADEALRPYVWINAMDDAGLERLARAKRSFHPRYLVPLYTVTRRRDVCDC